MMDVSGFVSDYFIFLCSTVIIRLHYYRSILCLCLKLPPSLAAVIILNLMHMSSALSYLAADLSKTVLLCRLRLVIVALPGLPGLFSYLFNSFV